MTTVAVSARRDERSRPRTWAILQLASAPSQPTVSTDLPTLLAPLVDGVVTVTSTERVGVAPDRPRAGAHAVKAGLTEVPEDVERVVVLDGSDLDAGTAPVLALLEELDRVSDAHDAVVSASPVTDALKRVEGGAIVGGVARADLHLPRPPLVVRRAALADALAASADRAERDVASVLIDAGRVVRVVRDDGATFTVGAGR